MVIVDPSLLHCSSPPSASFPHSPIHSSTLISVSPIPQTFFQSSLLLLPSYCLTHPLPFSPSILLFVLNDTELDAERRCNTWRWAADGHLLFGRSQHEDIWHTLIPCPLVDSSLHGFLHDIYLHATFRHPQQIFSSCWLHPLCLGFASIWLSFVQPSGSGIELGGFRSSLRCSSHLFTTHGAQTDKRVIALLFLHLVVNVIWAGCTAGNFHVHHKSSVFIDTLFSVSRHAIGYLSTFGIPSHMRMDREWVSRRTYVIVTPGNLGRWS